MPFSCSSQPLYRARHLTVLTEKAFIIILIFFHIIYCRDILAEDMTMPKFTSQILLLFSKVLHILEKLLLKNFTGLKVVS